MYKSSSLSGKKFAMVSILRRTVIDGCNEWSARFFTVANTIVTYSHQTTYTPTKQYSPCSVLISQPCD